MVYVDIYCNSVTHLKVCTRRPKNLLSIFFLRNVKNIITQLSSSGAPTGMVPDKTVPVATHVTRLMPLTDPD